METEAILSALKHLESGPSPEQQQASTHLVSYFYNINFYMWK